MSSLNQLDTPFVAVDLDVVERNLRTMQEKASSAGLKVRPHTKTHKQPWLAHRQCELGSVSLTVAKLDEAEVMLNAGLTDILIAYPLIGDAKAQRLAALMVRGLEASVSIDSWASMQSLSKAAKMAGKDVRVLVEVDTGFHRCGLTGSAVLELAQAIHHEPGLELDGLMSFAGHIAGHTDHAKIAALVGDDDRTLGHYRDQLVHAGLSVGTVSVGGTILSHNLQHLRHATEIRPGIYIFNDMGIVRSGAVTTDDCAARIWATVVSRPGPERAVLDAGSKMLSTDGPLDSSYGYIVGHPDWRIPRISEEHAVVEFESAKDAPEIGQRVQIIPNHVCTVMNLQNSVVGVVNGQVRATLPIFARGGTH